LREVENADPGKSPNPTQLPEMNGDSNTKKEGQKSGIALKEKIIGETSASPKEKHPDAKGIHSLSTTKCN